MKELSSILSAVAMTVIMLSSCSGGAPVEEGTLTEVTIGKQVWMSENLNVDRFRNGDLIPEAETHEEWEKACKNREPAWCYYHNNPDNGDRYGKLYNWFAVNDPRGLAPEGWKIPSNKDWIRLTDFLGGESLAGKKMKSTEFWADFKGVSGNGTNDSGFSGFPGGYRNENNRFYAIGMDGYWWSSTEEDADFAWFLNLFSDNNYNVYMYNFNKERGASVRCLRY